jgi:hypothetical protein
MNKEEKEVKGNIINIFIYNTQKNKHIIKENHLI